MTITMPCSACGHVTSATMLTALHDAHFDHYAAVHGQPVFNTPRATPSIEALRKLVSLVQGRA
jgi:hypothetical protein